MESSDLVFNESRSDDSNLKVRSSKAPLEALTSNQPNISNASLHARTITIQNSWVKIIFLFGNHFTHRSGNTAANASQNICFESGEAECFRLLKDC